MRTCFSCLTPSAVGVDHEAASSAAGDASRDMGRIGKGTFAHPAPPAVVEGSLGYLGSECASVDQDCQPEGPSGTGKSSEEASFSRTDSFGRKEAVRGIAEDHAMGATSPTRKAAIAVAVGTVAAEVGQMVDANIVKTVKEGMEVVAVAAGEGLVELSKTLPFLGPLAFVIGCVVRASVQATRLKEDCVQLGKTVSMVEGVIVRGKNLENQQRELEQIREHIEEALLLIDTVNKANWLSSIFFAHSDTNKFEEVVGNLQQGTSLLTSSCAVETASLLQVKRERANEQERGER
jgi:hypothetical protein